MATDAVAPNASPCCTPRSFGWCSTIRSTTSIAPSIHPMAIVATGGFGRRLLAPASDLDLLFVLPYKQTPWGESVVEYLLYLLWDLGLKVGHATRSVEQSLKLSKSDITIRTALLDARYILGDQSLFAQLTR